MKKIFLFTLAVITLGGCNRPELTNEKYSSRFAKNYLGNPDPYPHCENIPTFSRPLNQGEEIFYGSYFPNLDLGKARVTSISTKCYNCVAWTLGITDAWIWPDGGHILPSPEFTRLEFFDEFYQNLGYVKTTDPKEAHIEAWGIQPPKGQLYMTHASVVYAGSSNTLSYTGTVSETISSTLSNTTSNTTTWESKFGELERLTHGMNELEGDTYGKVVVYYKKSDNMENIQQLRKQYVMPRMTLTEEQYKKFNDKIVSIDKKTITEFDKKFEKWKETWNNDKVRLSSNPADRASSVEFQRLYQMGEVILPLIVQQLFWNPEDFFALLLYDSLQKDNKLKVLYDGPKDLQILEGEQSRANRTVRLYVESL